MSTRKKPLFVCAQNLKRAVQRDIEVNGAQKSMDMAFACAHFFEHGCGPLCEHLPCSTHLNPAGAPKDGKHLKCFGFQKCL
jgi:hypothetical protein